MMFYDTPPFAIVSLKKAGIKAPKDIEGKILGPQYFAFNILGSFDASFLEADNRKRRRVIEHHDSLNLLIWVLVPKTDQRINVEKAQRVSSCGDTGNARN